MAKRSTVSQKGAASMGRPNTTGSGFLGGSRKDCRPNTANQAPLITSEIPLGMTKASERANSVLTPLSTIRPPASSIQLPSAALLRSRAAGLACARRDMTNRTTTPASTAR